MTRVNVGIKPEELCDQMLLAELRELPRCYKHRTDAGPALFTLGTGHVLWCARHQKSLRDRHDKLHAEAVYRGFGVAPIRPRSDIVSMQEWDAAAELWARPLLVERIALRLTEMVRVPCWTKRAAPEWAHSFLLT